MSARALTAYSLGLVGLILVKVLAPGFYARQDIATPVRIGMITLVATLAMNAAFIRPLEHAGLALAIGLGACVNAALLYATLRRRGIFQPSPGWRRFLVRMALALALMAGVLWLAMGTAASWLSGGSLLRAGRLSLVVVAGASTYFTALWLLGMRPQQFMKRAS
jgi:putative peptidoglycan lipid II flippase